jgi:TRAP-type C4-dicarboxylate transport system permease small subunit
MTPSKTLARVFDRILKYTSYVCGAYLIFVMLSITVDVLNRKIFGVSSRWVVEIAEYSLVWITLLAAAWTLKNEKHVRMELLLTKLKPPNRAIVNIATSTIALLCIMIVAWYSLRITVEYQRIEYVTPTPLRLPQWIIMLALPVGFSLLLIQLIRRIAGYWVELKKLPSNGDQKQD